MILIYFLILNHAVSSIEMHPNTQSSQSGIEQQLLAMVMAVGQSTLLNNPEVLNKVAENMADYTVNRASSSLGKWNLTANCVKGITIFARGLAKAKPFAIKMVDSYGKLPSGITAGTVGALGDYDTCLSITAGKAFQGKYCRIEFFPQINDVRIAKVFNISKAINGFLQPGRHSRTLQPQTAICIPSTCTREDAKNMLLKIFPLPGLNISVKNCDTANENIEISSLVKFILILVSALFLLVIIATFLHLIQELTETDASEGNKNFSGSANFLHHFSMLRNAEKLFKKEDNPDSIRIFHGIRVLSTIWLIISHTITIVYDQPYGGLNTFYNMRKVLWFQLVPSSCMAVETFFFMSAVLLAYNITKNKDRHITIFLAFQRRYIRTTIPLFLMIATTCLLPLMGSGPLYKDIIGHEAENCQQLGWVNLLYINNFIPFPKMCMGSTWYLAADTQLFLLSLFILVPFRKNPSTMLKFIAGLFLFGLLGKVICIIIFNLPPTTLMLEPQVENLTYVWQRSYFSPIFHLSTYSIGLFVGYLLASKKQIKVSKGISTFVWITVILIQLGVVFGVHIWNKEEDPPGLITSILYGGTHRILWALTLTWVTFVCQANEKGLMTRFLGAEAFVPLSRLTYMAYLTNFTVKFLYVGTTRNMIIYDFRTMLIMVITVTTITCVASFVLTLVFESPFLSLEKTLVNKVIEKRKRNKDKKPLEEKAD